MRKLARLVEPALLLCGCALLVYVLRSVPFAEITAACVRIGPAAMGTGIDDANAVDKVGYGSGNSPEGSAAPPPPAAASSYERKAVATSTADSMTTGADAAAGNGYDSNDNSKDFVIRATRGPQNKASGTEQP